MDSTNQKSQPHVPFIIPVIKKSKTGTKANSSVHKEKFNHPFMESLSKISDKIDYLINQNNLKRPHGFQNSIINNVELCDLLKISSKTASNWRDEGILAYYQIKGKIYYKLSDINNLINKNKYVGKKKV